MKLLDDFLDVRRDELRPALLMFGFFFAVIAGFQWGVLGTSASDLGKTLVSVAATAVFFVVGLWYFRRSEPRFADTI